MTRERLSYRFGPLERRGIFGGVRAGQVAVVASGALLAIAIIDLAPTAGGGLVAATAFAASTVLAIAPIARRTAQEWAPVLAAFAARRPLGRHLFRSRAPSAGVTARYLGPRRRARPATPDLPTPLRGVTVLEGSYRDRPVGVIADRRGRHLSTVLACRVLAFSLLEAEAQERRLGRWGLVLSGAAGTAIRRIQWIERTSPAQSDELARWLHAQRDPAVPLRGTPIIESYLDLIGTTTRVAQEHEIMLAVQIDSRRVNDRGPDGPMCAVIEQAERIARGLEAAEVQVLGALGPPQLARALRIAFDPYARAELASIQAADPTRDGLPDSSAWPLGAREAWDHYRSDGALHATYWIGAWPRVEVSPMFMDALLGHSGAVRTVSVTFEPIPADRSTREVEAAVTRDRADRELRNRFGQSETARQRQAEEATARREAELAAGHNEVRFTGFVTVSGRDQDDLRRSCAEVLEHAARARLELHRMYGQQAEAFTFTLPLCRGLR